MIVDHMDNADQYGSLDEALATGLRFLSQTDFTNIPNGRLDIRGDEIYAVMNRYTTRSDAQARWEAHRVYIDIQYVVAGAERVEWGDTLAMQVTQAYDESKDCLFLDGTGDAITLTPGRFAIFFPRDAHQPGLALAQPAEVAKVVVKVAVKRS